MSWTKQPLGNVAELRLGKMLDEQKNKGQPLPYLGNINVRWGTFELDHLREMRFEENELERYGLKYGDIVMCEGGEPGRCAIWKEVVPGMMIQKALHRIRPHECLDFRYLYYDFLEKGRTGAFAPLFTGATIQHLPGQNLAKIEVAIPPIDVQRRIADILSAYDDLIENNRRRIGLLQQSARSLYKEWFVSLRFPGHEHVKVKDGVPEGWEKNRVGDLTGFLSRGISPSYDDDAPGLVINQKCIREGLLNLKLARHQNKEVPKDKLVRLGDVLVNSTGEGTLGRVAQVIEEIDNCTVDSHVSIVRPAGKVGRFYFGMALLGMESYLSTMGRGATNQTELSRATIADIEILVPPDIVSFEFETIVKNLYSQISNLLNQNEKLQQARDLLLPRLMNGEIPV